MPLARVLQRGRRSILERVSGHAERRVEVPKRWLPTQEYLSSHPDTSWRAAFPAAVTVRRTPTRFGPLAADFAAKLDAATPELGVVSLPGAYLVGRQGWVVSRDGVLLPEQSWYGRHVDEMRLPSTGMDVRRLSGTCLSLATDFAWINYGHFLLDGCGRLALLEPAGLRLADVDHVLWAGPSLKVLPLLARLGVDLDRCVRAKPRLAVTAERILSPSFPGSRRSYQGWLVDFLRPRLTPDPGPPHRRLYIPRTTTRRISNEAELLPILEAHGFESLDAGHHPDPRRLFAEAAVVVGAHGAGLTDLAFCQPGASVLEVVPSDHVQPYWYTLSEAAGLRYGYLVGRSAQQRDPSALGGSSSDLHVDVADFRAALEATLAAAPTP